MGKNRGLKRIWRSLKEYGWWGNWGIFGSLGSWVKYGGIWKEWKSVGVLRKVGGNVGNTCWSVGEVRGDVGVMGSSTHFPTPSFTFPLPHTSPYLSAHFSTPQHISPHLLPHFLTSSIFPPYLTQLPKLPKIPQLPHHSYSSKLPQIFYTLSFFPILHPPYSP